MQRTHHIGGVIPGAAIIGGGVSIGRSVGIPIFLGVIHLVVGLVALSCRLQLLGHLPE